MSKDNFQQAVYDYLNTDKKLPYNLIQKIKCYFNRLNFWDDFEREKQRKHRERNYENLD